MAPLISTSMSRMVLQSPAIACIGLDFWFVSGLITPHNAAVITWVLRSLCQDHTSKKSACGHAGSEGLCLGNF